MSAASLLRLLPASLALIPLIIAPGLLFYFDVTPKIVVLLVVTAVGLFFTKTNTQGIRALCAGREGRWLVYLLCGQALSILISTIFSHDVWLSITGSAWRRCGAVVELSILLFALLLAANIATSRQTLQAVLRFIAISCLLTSLYGIAQFLSIDPFLPPHSYHAGEGIFTIVRPPSTMGNANFLANYLVYATFCSLALVSWKQRDAWTWLGAAAFGVGMIAIVLSGTRSGIIGLLVGLGILVFGANSRMRYWIFVSGLCVVGLIAILAISPFGQPLKARVHWSREDVLGGGRLLLWRDSARMIASSPLIGFGPDQFSREFPKFQSLDLAVNHPDFYQESPHNAFLDLAAAAGAPALLLHVAILILGFYAAWRLHSDEPRLALCLAAALAGGTVCGQFSPPVMATEVYPLVLIAILCALGCRRQTDSANPSGFATSLCWSVGIALLFFAAALLVSDLMAASLKRAIDAANIESAAHQYALARKYALPGFDIDLYASRSLQLLSQQNAPTLARALAWQEAVSAGQRAIRTSEDRQNAFYNLAQIYARQNDIARTEQNLRSAIQSAPNWFKPHWVLAELLIRTGRIPEAREEARLAYLADGGKDAAVVRTWNALGSPR